MNKILETSPSDINGIREYLSQFSSTKVFICAFDSESFLRDIADGLKCPIDNVTENFSDMSVDISQFFSGFLLTSDAFILLSKTKAIGNIAGSAGYTEFLTLIDRIKQKKLKHLGN